MKGPGREKYALWPIGSEFSRDPMARRVNLCLFEQNRHSSPFSLKLNDAPLAPTMT